MTGPEIDVDAPDDEPRTSNEKAAEVVENDPGVGQEAGADAP